MVKKIIQAKWTNIVLFEQNEEDFISLTDIARYINSEDPRFVIQNWMRTKFTIEFLWNWEKLNNPDFKRVEFDTFKNEAGSNAFVMTPKKWIENTNAIWIVSKSWRYGWTYAHKDIALEFASWISPEFKLYIIKEFQRLKQEEQEKQRLGWDVKRAIASMNYKIQTDAIQEHLIPTLSEFKQKYAYADEADLINIVVYGQTAKEWRHNNPELAQKWNIRDYSNVIDLVIIANLENINAELIKKWLSKEERFTQLSEIAQSQKKSLRQAYDNNNKLDQLPYDSI